MEHNVNLAVQLLPLHTTQEDAYRIIDIAIERIQNSGLQYVVCPFETVIEGPYRQVMQLLDEIQEACFEAGGNAIIINMKLHRSASKDLYIDDKIGKYKE
jgi:uncharacterized protein YqgV (UPF0045/DUF77 family)